ncbi:MAG: hypothetical protein J5995_02730 [Muribaculaceae bacterium]|nr:hypothetical protein [Muribaculaceae bacterium]
MSAPTIFTRFLKELDVPHTASYSDTQFHTMTFKSLYGLSHLLTEYGVKNEGIKVGDKSELVKITPPFLAQTLPGTFVIVTDIDRDSGTVTYDTYGEMQTVDTEDFEKAWNGITLLAHPDAKSKEPDYGSHRLAETVTRLSDYALAAAAIVVAAYFFITRDVYAHPSTVLIAALDCFGLYLSYMLMQKSLHIKNAASDPVCRILEEGGCDRIMEDRHSKLFGVFSWSEVGFGYFGVSLATLLLFPNMWPELAVCNVCCLPYTAWSIWYQKFRAHHWCTMCVGVQATLWLLFFCYLGGGWLREGFPLHGDLFVLMAVYVAAVLALNLAVRILIKIPRNENNPDT